MTKFGKQGIQCVWFSCFCPSATILFSFARPFAEIDCEVKQDTAAFHRIIIHEFDHIRIVFGSKNHFIRIGSRKIEPQRNIISARTRNNIIDNIIAYNEFKVRIIKP